MKITIARDDISEPHEPNATRSIFANWLPRHFGCGQNNEALICSLNERFREIQDEEALQASSLRSRRMLAASSFGRVDFDLRELREVYLRASDVIEN